MDNNKELGGLVAWWFALWVAGPQDNTHPASANDNDINCRQAHRMAHRMAQRGCLVGIGPGRSHSERIKRGSNYKDPRADRAELTRLPSPKANQSSRGRC